MWTIFRPEQVVRTRRGPRYVLTKELWEKKELNNARNSSRAREPCSTMDPESTREVYGFRGVRDKV